MAVNTRRSRRGPDTGGSNASPIRDSEELSSLAAGILQPAITLGPAEVERALSLEAAFESQVMAFMSLATGEAVVPDPITIEALGPAPETIYSAARVTPDAGVVAKLVSVVERNPRRGLPLVVGVAAVLDPRTGMLAALIDAGSLTTLRTAAASAVAAASLAPDPARRLAVVGAGVQGRAHAMAIARALPIRQVRIHSRTPERRCELAAELAEDLDIEVAPAETIEEAVQGADVVALCTHSATPILLGEWVEPGAVVISVGSNMPDRREVDDTFLERTGRFVVDQREAAMAQGGPIIRALELGLCRPDQLVELGKVLIGEDPGRLDPAQVIFYNPVGIAVQDAAAAWVALHRARELGVGQALHLS